MELNYVLFILHLAKDSIWRIIYLFDCTSVHEAEEFVGQELALVTT